MIRRFFGLIRGVVVLGVLAYLLFFVQLGERTAFQHLMRIARTDEAKELGQEAKEASKRFGGKIKDQIRDELPRQRLPDPETGEVGTQDAPNDANSPESQPPSTP